MYSAIQYDSLPPSIFPGKQRIVQINPAGNYSNTIQSGETCRFQIFDQACLLDPFSTYFEITVSFASNSNLADDATFTNKIIQLDSSAHSLFSQQLLLHGNDELERLAEYDTLNAIFTDMDFSVGDKFCKDYEGLGGYQTCSMPSPVTTGVTVPYDNAGNSKTVKFWYAQENMVLYLDNNARVTAFGAATPLSSNTASYTLNHPILNNQLSFFSGGNNDAAVTFSAGAVTSEYYNDFTAALPFSDPTISGCIQHYSPAFCSNGMEPYFSSTVPQRYLNNGFMKTDAITSSTFYIPVRSGFIGQLMHPANLKYLPLWLMPYLALEMTFSPYAFFTSWFTTNQAARSYQVTNFVLHATFIEPSQEIRDQIDRQYMSGGIRIPSQSFLLGPRQNISSGNVPPTVQINNGFDSLRSIFFVFIPNDYTANAGCRKQYRLSMAITSLQIRNGIDFFPQQKVQGNGGTNFGPVNNYEFVKYLYMAFGKQCAPASIAINPHNFAINCRYFDPTLGAGSTIGNNNQAGFYEENRVIGKAVYAIPLDKVNYNGSTLGGLNTMATVPFTLELEYSSTKVFPRNVTMYVFCHYDTVLSITPGPGGSKLVKAYGRA